MSDDKHPPLPKIKALAMAEAAQRLAAALVSRHHGRDITRDDVERMHYAASGFIKPKHSYQLKQSLLQLVGQRLSQGQLRRLAWQIIGREAELDRRPIPFLDQPTAHGWVAVKIDSIVDSDWAGSLGYALELFCLTGAPAGFTITKKVPAGWLRYLAYQIGYSRRLTYEEEPKHLYGLYLWAYMISSGVGDVEMTAWQIDPKLKKENQAMLKLRERFNLEAGPECPFELDIACLECTKSPHECIASLRPIVDNALKT